MMPARDPATDEPQRLDPVYVHARREAIEILAAWAVAMAWTIGYCAAFGYGLKADQIELLFGIPDWVFWGVVVPWLAASAFTLYFSLVRMKLDPLGEEERPISAATGKED
jgi:hypothetical protein